MKIPYIEKFINIPTGILFTVCTSIVLIIYLTFDKVLEKPLVGNILVMSIGLSLGMFICGIFKFDGLKYSKFILSAVVLFIFWSGMYKANYEYYEASQFYICVGLVLMFVAVLVAFELILPGISVFVSTFAICMLTFSLGCEFIVGSRVAFLFIGIGYAIAVFLYTIIYKNTVALEMVASSAMAFGIIFTFFSMSVGFMTKNEIRGSVVDTYQEHVVFITSYFCSLILGYYLRSINK